MVTCQFQVTEYLCLPYGIYGFKCFQFTNYAVFNKDIKTQTLVESQIIIDDWDVHLP